MFIKSLAATAAAVIASLTIAPVAEAGLNHKAIVSKLHSLGITTQYGACLSNEHGATLGTYNSLTNHFCISDQIQDVQVFEETVIHELTHVIQDCIGGGIASSNLGSITRYLSDGDVATENTLDTNLVSLLRKQNKLHHVHKWTSHLPDHAKFIEVEAYALENSPLFVLKLLNQCGAY
jgi:hypothetical protein